MNWRLSENGFIWGDKDRLILDIHQEGCSLSYVEADFLVRAVNAHEEMLAILKELWQNEQDVTRRKFKDEMRFRLEEAIAKADGKS
jgi:hypothetical protein